MSGCVVCRPWSVVHSHLPLQTTMKKQTIIFQDLGLLSYKEAWDYQETLMRQNLDIKSNALHKAVVGQEPPLADHPTTNYLLMVEHPPVYTLGKSGKDEHVLFNEEERKLRGIEFFRINRGGDITFHGPGQLVGYPILDLENFFTDIGRYLRSLEEVIIRTLEEYGLKGERSKGETGVWIDPGLKGKERKICAMGVRCSRWITMHGFAFNINTDLSYFDGIIPCGIQHKQVTSLNKELGRAEPVEEVKQKLIRNFEVVFNARIIETPSIY
jgi:lipoyl(octanoyl) transferase